MTDEPPKTGRPTKLTQELQEALCEYVRKGNYLTVACDLIGVHESTVYRWLERGEALAVEDADAAASDLDPDDARFLDFYQAFTRARAQAEAMFVEVVVQVATGGVSIKEVIRQPDGSIEERQYTPPDAKPAFEWLARTRHERWGQRKALEVSGPNGAPVQLSHQADVADRLAARVAEVRAKRVQEEEGADGG
ncbi:hypothetical protein ACIHFD_49090 [Nonomuraea sp. NPDC051941]|uniref:hypothetical protein n=1 Tax=Nonomuraea sp. NPDC051941 TaxID=3364373 RepID=UPI0037CA6BA5